MPRKRAAGRPRRLPPAAACRELALRAGAEVFAADGLHAATMDQSGSKMSVIIVPGSGTGELKGIAGTFNIKIADGKHSYDLEYTLSK